MRLPKGSVFEPEAFSVAGGPRRDGKKPQLLMAELSYSANLKRARIRAMTLQGSELGAFRKQLLAWFRAHQRDLPWRRTKDPYLIWLSEIMLQQTRVAAVLPYYDRFIARFPDLQSLANSPEEDVVRFWSGLGYYSRARNLQRAARQIVAEHGGVFPRDESTILALPGIGRYTASAILSIAFRAKYAVLDGNVARVLARIFAVRGDLREPKRWKALQKSADHLLERKATGNWNQAMMELGAIVCTPRAPQCLLCPAAKFCRARKLGIAESLPARRQKSKSVEVSLIAVVLLDDQGRTLLLRPPDGVKHAEGNEIAALVSKMWHFPTRTSLDNPGSDVQMFLKDSLGARTKGPHCTLEALRKVRHTVTYRKITVHPFRVRVTRMPHIAGAKVIALTQIAGDTSLAISSLTRKIALTALQQATLRPPEKTALLFRAASA